jgi:hypothetical protein
MGKIYNIVLNSANAYGADVTNLKFFVNWARFEEGRYKLTVNFISGLITTTNATLCQIFTDMCQTDTFFGENPYTTNSQFNSFAYLGTCQFTGTGANNVLILDNNCNFPIYLSHKPQNNLFTVSLLNNDGNRQSYGPMLAASYSLTLTLELLD